MRDVAGNVDVDKLGVYGVAVSKNVGPETEKMHVHVGALSADTDLSAGGACHSSGASCETPLQNLGVDLATGLPTATQTMFRVE